MPQKTLEKKGPKNTKQSTGNLVSRIQQQGSSISAKNLIESIQNGLSVSELDELQRSLDIPMETLIRHLDISNSTVKRRRTDGKPFKQTESDRIVRFAGLYALAVNVMEGSEEAREWLRSPQYGLGMEIPLEYAETEVGTREVEDLLIRIDHGVFS